MISVLTQIKLNTTQNGRTAAKSRENTLVRYSTLLIKTESKRREWNSVKLPGKQQSLGAYLRGNKVNRYIH